MNEIEISGVSLGKWVRCRLKLQVPPKQKDRVVITMFGPRHGKRGYCGPTMSLAKAQELAAALLVLAESAQEQAKPALIGE
jgi:hypothetical protein